MCTDKTLSSCKPTRDRKLVLAITVFRTQSECQKILEDMARTLKSCATSSSLGNFIWVNMYIAFIWKHFAYRSMTWVSHFSGDEA